MIQSWRVPWRYWPSFQREKRITASSSWILRYLPHAHVHVVLNRHVFLGRRCVVSDFEQTLFCCYWCSVLVCNSPPPSGGEQGRQVSSYLCMYCIEVSKCFASTFSQFHCTWGVDTAPSARKEVCRKPWSEEVINFCCTHTNMVNNYYNAITLKTLKKDLSYELHSYYLLVQCCLGSGWETRGFLSGAQSRDVEYQRCVLLDGEQHSRSPCTVLYILICNNYVCTFRALRRGFNLQKHSETLELMDSTCWSSLLLKWLVRDYVKQWHL